MAARIPPDIELELTEQQIHDAAYLRADGRAWESVAVLLELASVSWLALRRIAESDPRFAPVLKRAAKAATKDAKLVALRHMKACAEKDDLKIAVKASEVLTAYAAVQTRNETRLKIERLRADVEREKLAARVRGEEKSGPEFAWPARPTPAERAAEMAARERGGLEGATTDGAEVYLWGGNHVTNVGTEPDATDRRVYLHRDHSLGRPVHWAIPEAAYLASGRGGRPIRPEDLREKTAPEG